MLLGAALAGAVALTGCDKVPLLAPSGSVITLIATSNVLAANGSIDIVATVIEQGATSSGEGGTSTTGQGTPVHNGTVVTFTSTIGTLDPREARTHNGQVTVKLRGDGRSGVAKITAYSGGASASLDVNVGAAAAERIVLTGTPQQLPAAGGTVALSARVEDISGNGLGGIEVSFATTAGTVSPPSAVTDDFGVARSSLTTTQAADVTASAGGKASTEPFKVTLAARTGITITPPSAAPTAGLSASFGVSVSSTSNVVNVTMDWGDGSSTSLGAISGSTNVSHIYVRAGTYTATATAMDAAGTRESVSTTVTVLEAAAVSVTVTASPSTPSVGQAVTFTATATPPAGTSITSYSWSFGDGTGTTTSGPSAGHVYTTSGTLTITVTASTNVGTSGIGQTVITVLPQVPISVTVSASSTQPVTNQTVTFTATTGTLPAGAVILRYEWNFGDGSIATTTSNVATNAYSSAGTKNISVRVVLSNGSEGTGVTTIVVTDPAPVTVSLSALPSTATLNVTPVLLTAQVGALPPGVSIVRYDWDFGDGTTTSGNNPSLQHVYVTAGVRTTRVNVVLSNGASPFGVVLVTVN